jgi:hypothetical protein
MAHHVLISHSAEDAKEAKVICTLLESNGMQCWMAPRDVQGGSSFPDAIVDAILESRVILLLFSPRSDSSEHVRREIALAFKAGKSILPFCIEQFTPSKFMSYFFSSVQVMDAVVPPLENHLERLVLSVHALLNPNLAPAIVHAPVAIDRKALREEQVQEAVYEMIVAEEKTFRQIAMRLDNLKKQLQNLMQAEQQIQLEAARFDLLDQIARGMTKVHYTITTYEQQIQSLEETWMEFQQHRMNPKRTDNG